MDSRPQLLTFPSAALTLMMSAPLRPIGTPPTLPALTLPRSLTFRKCRGTILARRTDLPVVMQVRATPAGTSWAERAARVIASHPLPEQAETFSVPELDTRSLPGKRDWEYLRMACAINLTFPCSPAIRSMALDTSFANRTRFPAGRAI